jgi:3-oxoacyl-[acyl-carrier protein] reductase
VLVNNAGFGIFKTVSELTAKEFDDVIATNLRGVFLITQAVLPAMRSKKAGTIITISSLAGKNGFATASAYCAAKFGVRGLMQSLFLEVREDNIRVVTICPGSVDTDFFTADTEHIRSKHALEAADVADAAFMVTQLPQNATISELDIRPTNPKG